MIASTVFWGSTLAGTLAIAAGIGRLFNHPNENTSNNSAAMYTLLDTGSVLEAEIANTVQPALKRTEMLAKSSELVGALISGDPDVETAILNSKITTATEVDALILFNANGTLSAINTCYANGVPISKDRLARIQNTNFSHRNIIQGCLRNNAMGSILEFQTHCDITPALFDSTGLSVAYSVPVINQQNGAKLGVLSSRLRFERLSELIKNRSIGGGSARAYFVTDAGNYFSEAINSGKEQPPIATGELKQIVAPLLSDPGLKSVTKHGDKYLATFSLPGMQTSDGGGIHILIVADGSWLTRGPRQERLVQAGGAGIVGTLLLIVAGLVHAGVTARRTRQAMDESNQANARLAAIVDSSTEAIISESLDGTIRSWNPGAEKMLGYSGQEAVGRHSNFLELNDQPDQLAAVCRTALRGERVEALETRCRHQSGQTIDIALSISLIKNSSGQVTAISRMARDITAQKRIELELETANDQLKAVHAKLVDAARQAGMAEVATGVLHNVGNVLNTVNVSAALIASTLKQLRVASLGKIAALLGEHEQDLAAFMTTDARGKMLPGFLSQLAGHLASEQSAVLIEAGHLQKNIEHIKEIVSAQQKHACSKGMIENLDLRELLESALRMHTASLSRHEIITVQDFQETPPVPGDKHKVLQILVNLITNARHAMKNSPEKKLTLKIQPTAAGTVQISIRDTGCGIAPENITRVFNHGFTTKTDGHGFGLHSSALAAQEMKGSLSLHSDGPALGATFTLELPLAATLHLAA